MHTVIGVERRVQACLSTCGQPVVESAMHLQQQVIIVSKAHTIVFDYMGKTY